MSETPKEALPQEPMLNECKASPDPPDSIPTQNLLLYHASPPYVVCLHYKTRLAEAIESYFATRYNQD
jgi:hypothetical protein